MPKRTYARPEVKVYELGPEYAQICKTSDETSTTSEPKFFNEASDEEQF